MKKFLISISILFTPLLVLAAGGGGGGGGGGNSILSCSQSTWSCTEWTACSSEGKRTRTCAKLVDCASDTSRPQEQEVCTPPILTPVLNLPVPSPVPEPRSEPKVEKPKVPAKPSSAPVFKAPKYWCYSLPLLKQRVECRIGLTEEGLKEEYARQYLPEECRALRNKKQQGDCVTRYKVLQPCWGKPIGDERIACAKEVIGLPGDVRAERAACAAKARKTAASKKASVACLTALRQKMYHLVKFRFYDLNERVEEYFEEAKPKEWAPGIAFIVASELNKQRFNAVRTKRDRLRIIENERQAWKRFTKTATVDDARDFLDEAKAELSSVE